MARVKSYSNDSTLTGTDRILGTDAAGGLNSTANFSLQDIRDFVISGLGIDITKRVGRNIVPIVGADSMDVYPSTITRTLTPQSRNIRFNTVAEPVAIDGLEDNNQKARIAVVIGAQDDYLEITNPTFKYDIYSFAGKKFQAMWGTDNTDPMNPVPFVATGTIGELERVDDKYYVVESDGDIVYRFKITRSGSDASWLRFTNANTEISDFRIYGTHTNTDLNNNGTSLTLIQLSVGGDLQVNNFEAIDGFDVENIEFKNATNGVAFREENKTPSVSLLLEEPPVAEQPIPNNYDKSAATLVISGASTSTGTGNTAYFNKKVDSFDFNTSNFVSSGSIQDGGHGVASNTNRDQSRVEITHDGINYYYFDGSEAGTCLPVIPNNITTYVPPATDDLVAGARNKGVLTTLMIGEDYYSVPTGVSQVAQVLPGVQEDLQPIPDGTLELVSTRNIGSRNSVSMTNGLALTTWAADDGNFAIYALGSANTMSLSGSTFSVTPSTGTFASASATSIVDVGTYLVIQNDSFDNVVGGDIITINDNTAGSTNTLVLVVHATRAITRLTDSSDNEFTVLPLASASYNGTAFALNTGDYTARVHRPAGSGSTITPTYWFYGVDHGTYVEFRSVITDRSDIAAQPTGIPALSRGTSQYIGATGNVFNQNTVLNIANTHIPAGQRLFWTEATPPAAQRVSGATVAGNVYEVVAYIHNNGNTVSSTTQATLSWSLVGVGHLRLGSPTITMNSIPENTHAAPEVIVRNPLLADGTGGELRFLDLQVDGMQAVATYDVDGRTDAGAVTGISFDSSLREHNIEWTSGRVKADITGRIPFETAAAPRLTNFTAVEWTSYVLNHPTAARTITLPSVSVLNPGDTIRFFNLSDIAADGSSMAITNSWTITTPGTERIMKATTDLVLDEATEFDLIWSGIDSVGWLIK